MTERTKDGLKDCFEGRCLQLPPITTRIRIRHATSNVLPYAMQTEHALVLVQLHVLQWIVMTLQRVPQVLALTLLLCHPFRASVAARSTSSTRTRVPGSAYPGRDFYKY